MGNGQLIVDHHQRRAVYIKQWKSSTFLRRSTSRAPKYVLLQMEPVEVDELDRRIRQVFSVFLHRTYFWGFIPQYPTMVVGWYPKWMRLKWMISGERIWGIISQDFSVRETTISPDGSGAWRFCRGKKIYIQWLFITFSKKLAHLSHFLGLVVVAPGWI